MTRYGYYPGCCLYSWANEDDISLKLVGKYLDIEFEELKNWTCCGSQPAHSTSRLLSLALPMRNLSLAQKQGLSELIMPCTACFSRFKIAIYETSQDPELLKEVEKIVGYSFEARVKVMHPLEILSQEEILSQITKKVKRDLSHLKVVCFYGCLLTRPPKVMQFDTAEYPMSMDNVLKAIGITTLEWSYKTDCCGAAFSIIDMDILVKLSVKILEEAKAQGAECIVTCCPLCQSNLDTRQQEIEKKYNNHYRLPILFFTQLMGLAFGIEPKELGLDKHFVDTESLIAKII